MGDDPVKVYIYEAVYDSPHEWEWMDRPYSPVGDMLAFSERHAHVIPREQYERWKAAAKAFDEVQREIIAIKEAGRP